MDFQAVAGRKLAERNTIAGHLRARVRPVDEFQRDHRAARNHDGAIGQRMRTNGRDHQHVEMRRDDGAAAGKRIRSRTRGTGHHHAITAVGVHIDAVDPRFEIEHAGGFPTSAGPRRMSASARLMWPFAPMTRCLEQRTLIALAAGLPRAASTEIQHVLGQYVGSGTQAAAIGCHQWHAATRGRQARAIQQGCRSPLMAMTRSGVIGDFCFRGRDRRGPQDSHERVGLGQQGPDPALFEMREESQLRTRQRAGR
jgi:hypothetical protein